jgi:hypothetical protein
VAALAQYSHSVLQLVLEDRHRVHPNPSIADADMLGLVNTSEELAELLDATSECADDNTEDFPAPPPPEVTLLEPPSSDSVPYEAVVSYPVQSVPIQTSQGSADIDLADDEC